MPRPKTNTPRNIRLMTRVTEDDAAKIREKAQRLNVSVSTFLSLSALGIALPTLSAVPEINRTLYLELSRYNANLNQLARHLNAGRVKAADEEHILTNLRGMYALIKQVRRELCG